MSLQELIQQHPEIFADLPGRINMGESPDTVDEVWFEAEVGTEPASKIKEASTFILRLTLYEETTGDIKASTELVNYVDEVGEVDRTFLKMRNWEDMRVDLEAEAKVWEIAPPDLTSGQRLLVAAERIQLTLADDVLCVPAR